jgi:HAD superfamily hydrolase (TIGR01662 family)
MAAEGSAAAPSGKRPAVFLDRDGVLNEDRAYVHRLEDFVWLPGAIDAVKYLNDRGTLVFVATNQSGVARGFYAEEPYHVDGTIERYRRASDWRKPAPGMILDLMAQWDVDRARSFLVGDQDSDMAAAKAAGIAGFQFTGGNLLEFIRAAEARVASAQ